MSILDEDITAQCICITPPTGLDVALLTGGCDRPYACGLAMALVSKRVRVDVIGSDEVDSPEMHTTPGLKFFNVWSTRHAHPTLAAKLLRTVRH